MGSLTDRIKAEAIRLGFDLVGVAEVRASDHGEFYRAWLAAGRHGSMEYLAREDAVLRRLEPSGFCSAIVVGLNYYAGEGEGEGEGTGKGTGKGKGKGKGKGEGTEKGKGKGEGTEKGKGNGKGIIARYAWGRDYHKVIKKKLLMLLRFVEEIVGREMLLARAYVDTGPVLEREVARRAGLGWFGRNTMMINPKRGSYFFLGSLLLDVELEADAAFEADHCGTCSACVSACPTGALLGRDVNGAPVMDATRCISYLTIENRGAIPLELRPLMGTRIFGCDICQEVCPWNGEKFVQLTREPSFSGTEVRNMGTLIELMQMDDAAWDEFSRGSAMRRAKRSGFLRNVAVALGNSGDERALPVLEKALDDAEPLIREHAAWAIAEIRSRKQ